MIQALHHVTDFQGIGPHRLRVSVGDGVVRDIDSQPVLAGNAPCDGRAREWEADCTASQAIQRTCDRIPRGWESRGHELLNSGVPRPEGRRG